MNWTKDQNTPTVIVVSFGTDHDAVYANTQAMREDAPGGAFDALIKLINDGAVSGSCPNHPEIKFRVMRVRS